MSGLVEHAPQNALTDPGDIARFHDRCSELMHALLHALADAPDQPRPFPEMWMDGAQARAVRTARCDS